MAGPTSDSHWHRELSGIVVHPPPYWLAPFWHHQTFCPYLVGTYARVGEELGRYVAAGYPPSSWTFPPTRRISTTLGSPFSTR